MENPEAKYTPVALQGFTAFSNFSSGKPVGQCVEEVVGKPIELLPLCELIGNPNALAMFGLSSLPPFSALQLQFVLAPSGQTLARPPRFSTTAQHHILLKAVFELQADSSITNCKLLENSAGEALGDLCSAIRSGVTDFDVSGSNQLPVSMTFVLDTFAE